MNDKWLLGIIVVTIALIACGCGRGPARSAVRGKITFDGNPVDGGRISFVPTGSGGIPASAAIIGGEYDIPAANGPSVGGCKVEIQWAKKTGRKLEVPPNRIIEETRESIPAIYNKESQLNFDVKQQPSNEFSIDIKP
jgi:hypothetical protein